MTISLRHTLIALAVAATALSPAQAAPDRTGTTRLDRGGFSARQIGPDRFLVRYMGNIATSDRLLMRRLIGNAAQLTIDRGYDHFTFDDEATEQEKLRHLTTERQAVFAPNAPPIKNIPGSEARSDPGPFPFGLDSFHGGWAVKTLRTNGVTMIVTLGHGAKPVGNELSFDARSPTS